MLALELELVEPVLDEIDEVSKAAGVRRSGNVRGEDEDELAVEEVSDELSVDESEVDEREERDDSVEACEAASEEEYFELL